MGAASSLYDVLGVDKSADHAAIKRAYRRKAAKAHPDRGGSQAEMAELNRAWECLGDPARRIAYDQTGKDAATSIDEEAKSVLMNAFAQLLDVDQSFCGNILAQAERAIKETRDKLDGQRSDCKEKLKTLEKRRDRVRFRKDKGKASDESKRNLFHLVADAKIAAMRAAVAHMERGIEVYTAALKMLKDYESDEESPIMRIKFDMVKMGTTTSSSAWNFGTGT